MAMFMHEPPVGIGTADFVAGWNACLANANINDASHAWHSGWVACSAAAAHDEGSFLSVEPLVFVKPREGPPYNPFKRWL
jgi:hypothetical protein